MHLDAMKHPKPSVPFYDKDCKSGIILISMSNGAEKFLISEHTVRPVESGVVFLVCD